MPNGMEGLLCCRYQGDDPECLGIDPEQVRSASTHANRRAQLLADAVRISGSLMPRIGGILNIAQDRLMLDAEVEAYVYNDASVQAGCVSVEGGNGAALLLSSGLINLMSEDELLFVIGHEIGHAIFGHHFYPAPEAARDEATRLNWLALNRAAEISSDRIGLVASQSLENAFRAILKTGTGLGSSELRFDMAAFLDQLRTLQEIGGHAPGIASTHPMLTVRMKSLAWFEMSDVARQLRVTPRHGVALTLVDARIERLMEQATGETLGMVRQASIANAEVWAFIYLAVADGRLSREEQEAMGRIFGPGLTRTALDYLRDNGVDQVGPRFEDAMREVRFLPESLRRGLHERFRNNVSSCDFGSTDVNRLFDVIKDRLGLSFERGGAAHEEG